MTLAETAYSWIRMAHEGEILNRSGSRYKPSALRTIERNLQLRLMPELGVHAMREITRADLQRRVGAWRASGLSASTVRGTVNAARVLWRDFDLITGLDNQLPIDPTRGLRLPADTGGRDRIATPDEALRLIEALDEKDQALWETAMTAGLRHGELRALPVDDLDFANKRINVSRGWDQYEGEIDVKSEKGDRSTVVMTRLEQRLTEHLARTGASGSDLVFGRDAWTPFASSTVSRHARRAWAVAREQEDLENEIPPAERIRPIGLHECRHTAVSQMLDAGISIDKVSKFMGHASIAITIDRYSHLLPEGEAEAIALLDAYHERHR
jgi:integrase